jgi:hypothetical protein
MYFIVTGKESVVKAISHHVYITSKKHNACNVQLFKCHTNSYAQKTPFSAFRPVLQEMILRLYQTKKSGPGGRQRSLVSATKSVNTEMNDAVDY